MTSTEDGGSDSPVISIITPCLNRAQFIGAAIESALGQGYPYLEHIVVDGGSTDGTLRVLAQYPHLRVVSEPDGGMYEALNKGLALASGAIVGFLNSDDLYAPGIFEDVEKALRDDRAWAVVGEAIVFSEAADGGKVIVDRFSPGSASLLELATVGTPFFNAWFFRRTLFEKIGGFAPAYRIVGDRDFMLRLALSELPYAIMNRPVYEYREHSGALTFDVDDAKLKRVVDEHLVMTGIYLRQEHIPPGAREKIRDLRMRDTQELCIRYLRKGDLLSCIRYALAGVPHGRGWFVSLLQRLARRVRSGHPSKNNSTDYRTIN